MNGDYIYKYLKNIKVIILIHLKDIERNRIGIQGMRIDRKLFESLKRRSRQMKYIKEKC